MDKSDPTRGAWLSEADLRDPRVAGKANLIAVILGLRVLGVGTNGALVGSERKLAEAVAELTKLPFGTVRRTLQAMRQDTLLSFVDKTPHLHLGSPMNHAEETDGSPMNQPDETSGSLVSHELVPQSSSNQDLFLYPQDRPQVPTYSDVERELERGERGSETIHPPAPDARGFSPRSAPLPVTLGMIQGPNRFRGKCVICGKELAKGEGILHAYPKGTRPIVSCDGTGNCKPLTSNPLTPEEQVAQADQAEREAMSAR